ncbi:MAG: IS21 family transposase [Thermovirgaceae bacterium]
MVVGVDQYKRIRKMAAEDGLSQREIARRLGISRNTVARYCKGEHMPWESAKRDRKPGIVNQDIERFIRSCLEHDKDPDIPKKQHHTARRIYERLVSEKGFTGGESTIRRWVNHLREECSIEAFMPLEFALGEAAQADWGETIFYLGGERTRANLLCFRLCGSRHIDVRAYPRKDLESFLEGHRGFFERIGGVPRTIIYDNLRTAVRKDWGKRAVCQKDFERFSAHYAFTPRFCNIGKGNEKGLVEGLVGYARRTVFVPVPHVDTWNEVNESLAEHCDIYKKRRIRGQKTSVAELFEAEQETLLPLPRRIFETAKVKKVKVDHFSTVGIDGNRYSVPVRHAGRHVTVKLSAFGMEVFSRGENIACHERCFGREQTLYELKHYIPLLEKKPRSVNNAAPVATLDIPAELRAVAARSIDPDRTMVRILKLCADHGIERVAEAARRGPALSLDTLRLALWEKDGDRVEENLSAPDVRVEPVDLGSYDRLLEHVES